MRPLTTIVNEPFESRLSGGHPNSLGNTVAVVEDVLSDREKLQELYECYFSEDEVVRLRTSSAMKRISKERPDWLLPFVDRFLTDVAKIDQASTQWTLAYLFQTLGPKLSKKQISAAKHLLKNNIETHSDWIVLNNTMEVLAEWSHQDPALRQWLRSQLIRLQKDSRKSVARRATKLHQKLNNLD